MKDAVVIEDVITLFESVQDLGRELGHNVTWGQFEEMHEMLGKTCIHTKQAARNVIMNEKVYNKLQVLQKNLERIVDE